MKLIAYLLLLFSAVMGVASVEVQKSFLVYFNNDATENAINQAKQKILDAKGSITHEYRLLKGFAATAGEKVFESLQVTGQSNGFTVEEDQTFNTNSGS